MSSFPEFDAACERASVALDNFMAGKPVKGAQETHSQSAITAVRHIEDGVSYTRFSFANSNAEAQDASQVLIEFLLTLVDDDRECPHGYTAGPDDGHNYIDIPTAAWDATLASLENDA